MTVRSHNRQMHSPKQLEREIAGYAGRESKLGDDVRRAIETLTVPTFAAPSKPAAGADKYDEMEYGLALKQVLYQRHMLDANLKNLWSIVWGQCTEVMQAKLKADDAFDGLKANSDSLGLIKVIKQLSYNSESQKYELQLLYEATKQFYNCRQEPRMTAQIYLERFNNALDVVEYCGGTVGVDKGLIAKLATARGEDIATLTSLQLKVLEIDSRERYLAVAFLLGADRQRYGKLIIDIENNFLKSGDDGEFPNTVTQAFGFLTHYKDIALEAATALHSCTLAATKWHSRHQAAEETMVGTETCHPSSAMPAVKWDTTQADAQTANKPTNNSNHQLQRHRTTLDNNC